MGLDILFGWILDKIEKGAPLSWVYPWQESIRVCGGRYKKMGPGFHLKLPWAMRFEDEDVTWAKISCPQQRVCSRDGTTWLITLIFDRRVSDIVLAHVKRDDYDEGVLSDAMATVAEWVNSTTSEELSIEALKADCTDAIKAKAKHWGCSVKNVDVTDFAPFDKVYCVVGQEGEAFPVE